MDCFAALAMTIELIRLFLGVALFSGVALASGAVFRGHFLG